MKHHVHSHSGLIPVDAGRRVAQLRHVLRLVEELAGSAASAPVIDTQLDEAAYLTSLYYEAVPIVQRRFDILAAEIATWSAAGVEALLTLGATRSPAAVRRLARELEQALNDLVAMLRPAPGRAARGAIPLS